jgi:hypothetical protein
MKKEKLNLKSIKNVLSRDEMKRILAGSNGCYLGFMCNCPNGSSFCTTSVQLCILAC